jgi:hypothetical protein
MKTEKLTEARFLEHVAKHQMIIKLDHGVYRHVVFRNPDDSNMWFELITYPGRLVYSGDMGCFVFNRLHDMFTFFRGRVNPSKPDALYINEGYWHEKLEAVDRHDGSEGYSFAKFKEACEEQIASFLKDESEDIELLNSLQPDAEPFEAELREAVENEVYSYAEESQTDAYRVANDFTFSREVPYDNGLTGLQRRPHTLKVEFTFSDIWECNSNEYSLRFLWCCYALNWAIRVYDAHHAALRLAAFSGPTPAEFFDSTPLT